MKEIVATVSPTEVEHMIQTGVKNAVNTTLADLADDVKLIKTALLGDEFNPVGMKKEHDEMFESYRTYRREDFATKLTTLWKYYDRWTWILTFFGVSSFASIVAIVLAVITFIDRVRA